MSAESHSVAVLGGGVSGLAAAEAFHDVSTVDSVTLFERQSYGDKRVDCGEAINAADLVPLSKTPSNGFRSGVRGFELRVYPDRVDGTSPLEVARFPCEEGYICDRDTVERRWAERLSGRGVTVKTGANSWDGSANRRLYRRQTSYSHLSA